MSIQAPLHGAWGREILTKDLIEKCDLSVPILHDEKVRKIRSCLPQLGTIAPFIHDITN